MQRRPYGTTGEHLSAIGFGGIVVSQVEAAEAARLVGRAVERGVNYFDVAPSYGNAEERLGPALEPYRRDVFLACKTTERTRAGAAAELRQSLKTLRTDHFDLYQLHAMTTAEDFAAATGPDGALAAFVEAREQGLVRYIVFQPTRLKSPCNCWTISPLTRCSSPSTGSITSKPTSAPKSWPRRKSEASPV